MPFTPIFGWPYQSLLQPPDGPNLGEDLALAIEATVQTQFALVKSALASKPADETVNNTTVLQSDDHLFLPVEANSIYHLEVVAFYNSSTVADIKFNMALPAGAVMAWGGYIIDTAGAFAPSANFQPVSCGGLGASNGVFVHHGRLQTAATAGPAQLQWAQNTAEVSNTKVLGGSFIKLQKIG